MSFDLTVALPGLLDALNAAHVGFLVFRLGEGKIEKVYVNPSLVTSLGYTADEWLGSPLWHVVAPEQKQPIAQIMDRLAADAPVPAAIEVRLIGSRMSQKKRIGEAPSTRAASASSSGTLRKNWRNRNVAVAEAIRGTTRPE